MTEPNFPPPQLEGWRNNETEAWQAVYLVFDRKLGALMPDVLITMDAMKIRSFAVDAIMEFQWIMGKKGGEQGHD